MTLKIVIGSYGLPWLPYHGATGGISLPDRARAEKLASYLSRFQPRLPSGLWPGSVHRVIEVELDGDVERGQIVAICEKVE